MRELTKALGSFSVAISTFGTEQLLNLAKRPVANGGHPTTEGLEAASAAVKQQLAPYARQVFDTGDEIQRGAIDLAWGVLTLRTLQPRKLLDESSNLLVQSTKAVSKLVPGSFGWLGRGPASPTLQDEPCGWGPMP